VAFLFHRGQSSALGGNAAFLSSIFYLLSSISWRSAPIRYRPKAKFPATSEEFERLRRS
jgi:hypothetical protein